MAYKTLTLSNVGHGAGVNCVLFSAVTTVLIPLIYPIWIVIVTHGGFFFFRNIFLQ